MPYLPAPPAEATEIPESERPPRPALAIDAVRLFVNGSEYSPAAWFERNLVESVEKADVFAQVIDPGRAELAPDGSARATVTVTEWFERNHALSFPWFMLSFLTGSLPTMLFPIETDAGQLIAIDFTLPSGEVLTYRIETVVTRELYLVYMPDRGAYRDVLWTNLRCLTARLKREPALRQLAAPSAEQE